MDKTDKEYTIEVICAYLNTWGNQNCSVPVGSADLPKLITSVYNAIYSLDMPSSDSEESIE